jgi:hypothetical protein
MADGNGQIVAAVAAVEMAPRAEMEKLVDGGHKPRDFRG